SLPRFFGILHFKNTGCAANFAKLTNLTTAFSIKRCTVKANNAPHALSSALGWTAILIKGMNNHATFFKLLITDKGGWVFYLDNAAVIDIKLASITRPLTLCLHVLIKLRFINHNTALTGNISGQVNGEAGSII